MIPANGPTRVEFFIGGMVIDPNGTILRLDISDGFAEITQNGTMNRNVILKDWLPEVSGRVTFDETNENEKTKLSRDNTSSAQPRNWSSR